MVEARRELCLAQEALTEALVPRQLRREKLQRHPTAPVCVFGQIDGAHRTRADERLDSEAGQHAAGGYLRPHRSCSALQAPMRITRAGFEHGRDGASP
jgi:hypothetical protein